MKAISEVLNQYKEICKLIPVDSKYIKLIDKAMGEMEAIEADRGCCQKYLDAFLEKNGYVKITKEERENMFVEPKGGYTFPQPDKEVKG